MDTDGPPPAHEPNPTPRLPIQLNHRNVWRRQGLRYRMGSGEWRSLSGLGRWLPDELEEAVLSVPESKSIIAKHLGLMRWGAGLGFFGLLSASFLSGVTVYLRMASSEPEIQAHEQILVSCILLCTLAGGVGVLLIRDAYRMFFRAVDAYNEKAGTAGEASAPPQPRVAYRPDDVLESDP